MKIALIVVSVLLVLVSVTLVLAVRAMGSFADALLQGFRRR